MNYLQRIIRFIRIHYKLNKKYFFSYTFNYFNPNFVPNIKYLELSDLVSLLKEGKSLIRIGDGEVYIMNFGSIGYQDYDPKLRDIFLSIIREYNDNSNYVVGLNKIPISKTNRQLKKDRLFHCWLPMKVYWDLFFNKSARYFDATLFYYNETIPRYFEDYLKSKHLILVTNLDNIKKFKDNEFIPFTDVSYIETPPKNAFSVYEKLKNNVREVVSREGKERTIVLAACGPASKPLAYELSKEGIVTVDIGRGIEVSYTEERIDHIIYPVNK